MRICLEYAFWTVVAIAVMVFLAAPVFAQGNNCSSREMMIERLARVYGEVRQSVGLDRNNALVETFASAETGSWTVLVTPPGKPTCVVASGQSFELVRETIPGKPT